MIRTILVPLDGSEFGDAALPTACAIAERAHAALHLALVHVPVYSTYVEGVPILDPELDQASRANDHAYLEAVRERLAAETGQTAIIAALDGPVADRLAEYAAHIEADLVVMTTHGRGGLERFWLGSVADEFVRHTHLPTLLIRPDSPADPSLAGPLHQLGNILVTLDGSPLAEEMLAPALALGTLFDADYTFVQVVDAIVIASLPFIADQPQREYAAVQQRAVEAQRYLEALAVPLRAEGRRITTRVLVDPQPAQAILREARERDSDLIALATHGRSGVRRQLLGSVADKVLRGADRPVLLYRPAAVPRQARAVAAEATSVP